ncbi:MBL fold metallo-hydrolase [Phaeobacter inhibens]|uniref:MBL fold metallo-hydrolase n=1 Tax=Phaeobacter inhibens TaxID=221822 RepID=UPI0021A34829|nr:MBL fold metallo-hydrolase [Phaeobacter inhibens]UWR81104.1 MBL fold metallo-hydrolase [Phaeobacter inhibens]
MNRRQLLKSGAALTLGGGLPAVVRAAQPGVSLRWLGGAMLEIEAAGLRVLTDPCLGEGAEAFVMGDPNEMFDLARGPNIKSHARLTPFPGLRYDRYDLVLLSHVHEDHFDQAAQAWLDPQLPMLVPQHDLAAVRQKGFAASALAHGEMRRIEGPEGVLRITALPAVHSENPEVARLLGLGNGYLIEVETAFGLARIYWAGDSFLVPPVWQALRAAQVAEAGLLDVFVPHLGAVGGAGALGQISMDGAQAAGFAQQLEPQAVLPIHHSTYALYREGPEVLRQHHAELAPRWRLRTPPEGECIHL